MKVIIYFFKIRYHILLPILLLFTLAFSCRTNSNHKYREPSDSTHLNSHNSQGKSNATGPEITSEDIVQAEPNSAFKLSYRNHSEQIYFPNGKVVDAKEYAVMLNKFPQSSLKFDTLEDGSLGSTLRGVFVDFRKMPESIRVSSLTNIIFYQNSTMADVAFGDYYGQISWEAAEIGYPFILEKMTLYNDSGLAIGETGMLYTFDSLGQQLNTFNCNEYGLYGSPLTLDSKYICIYSGYYQEGKEVIPERYRIYDFHKGSLVWETTNLPNEFGSPFPCVSYFYSNGYVFYPERKKVYYLNSAKVRPIREFKLNGILLINGTYLDFNKDWKEFTLDEFNTRNIKID